MGHIIGIPGLISLDGKTIEWEGKHLIQRMMRSITADEH